MRCRHIRNLLLSLVVSGLLVGCGLASRSNNTYREMIVQDEDSRLIPLLIAESDFPPDWHWYSVMTKQETIAPTSENNNLAEKVVVGYRGYYQKEDIPVRIWQTIESDKINLGVDSDRIVSTFYPDIKEGDITKCVYLREEIKCALLKKQDDLLFTLEFSIPRSLGEEKMLMWLTYYAKDLSQTK
jgi:hypothetical protein